MGLADMLLLKTTPPEGWIDLGIGEAHNVRETLIKILGDLPQFSELHELDHLQYPRAQGDPGLLSFLQQKHQTKNVVITNGAKHGISAALYALRELRGIERVYVPKPYWLSFPTLIRHEGMKFVEDINEAQAVIITSPNNPDGSIAQPGIWQQLKLPIIVDSAYNAPQYLRTNQLLSFFGDVHVFSYAKSLGLSGARVGYTISQSEDLTAKMAEYMEITTSGVSIEAQRLIELIERFFVQYPHLQDYFYQSCRLQLDTNRQALQGLDDEVLSGTIPKTGMFVFLKAGPYSKKIEEAKVKMIEGLSFGMPGYYRISLGVSPSTFQQAVNKINRLLVWRPS